MADDMPETEFETWIFGGSRVNAKGKRVHAWIPGGSVKGLLFAADGSYTVGCEYRAKVARSGDSVTLYGKPTFERRHDDATLRAQLEAAHTAAETRLKLAAIERSEKRSKALDEALEPILAVARNVAPMDREAFTAYVINRVTREFWR